MQKLSQFILKASGWKIIGEFPKENKYVVIVAPHTSNWDFLIGSLARSALGPKIYFFAKSQLFFFPLGFFLKAIGGIPVDRSKKNKMVDEAVSLFRSREEFKLAITPEGTRSSVTRWKEGFYHIASQAELPIAMVGFDFPSKEIRISEPFYPSGDISKDLPQVLDYFRVIKGYYPKEIPKYILKK